MRMAMRRRVAGAVRMRGQSVVRVLRHTSSSVTSCV
jgi:hypothetical protein